MLIAYCTNQAEGFALLLGGSWPLGSYSALFGNPRPRLLGRVSWLLPIRDVKAGWQLGERVRENEPTTTLMTGQRSDSDGPSYRTHEVDINSKIHCFGRGSRGRISCATMSHLPAAASYWVTTLAEEMMPSQD